MVFLLNDNINYSWRTFEHLSSNCRNLLYQTRNIVRASYSRDSDSTNVDYLTQYVPSLFSEIGQHGVSEDTLALLINDIYYLTSQSVFKPIANHNDLPVYSLYSSELYTAFQEKHTVDNIPDAGQLFFKYFDQLPVKIKKYATCRFASTKLYLHELLFTNLINSPEFSGNNYSAISIKSYCTGSNYDYTLEHNLSLENSKKTYVVPVLVRTKIYNYLQSAWSDIYMFTFHVKAPVSKYIKYKKAKLVLKDIFQKLYLHKGSYFYNLEEYNNSQFASSLQRYVPTEQNNVYEDIAHLASSLEAPVDFISTDTILKSFAQYKYPLEFSSKLHKYKDIADTTLDSLNSTPAEILQRINKKNKLKNKIYHLNSLKNQLAEIEESISQIESELASTTSALAQSFSTVYSAMLKYSKAKDKFTTLERKRLEYHTEDNLALSQTLSNLLETIDLVSFVYLDKNGKPHKITNSIETVSLFLNNDKIKIQELEYQTKELTIFKVDGRASQQYVAGPFQVKYESNNLYVKPRDINSYYAVVENGADRYQILYHPHTNGAVYRIDSDDITFSWARACLGEAQSIIYKAASAGDLAGLIIAINIWLSSANSADVWGKRYNNFVEYKDYAAYTNWLQESRNCNQTQEQPSFQLETTTQQDPPVEIVETASDVLNDSEQTVQQTTYVPYIRGTNAIDNTI